MATREVLALNEGTLRNNVPQTGDTYSMPRTVTITPEVNTGALVLTGGGRIDRFRRDAQAPWR